MKHVSLTNDIYAIEYDLNGWEKRTLMGSANTKGIAWFFAQSVKHLYAAVRIIYADGSSTLINKEDQG